LSTLYFKLAKNFLASPGNCISRSDALESEDLTAQQLTALFY